MFIPGADPMLQPMQPNMKLPVPFTLHHAKNSTRLLFKEACFMCLHRQFPNGPRLGDKKFGSIDLMAWKELIRSFYQGWLEAMMARHGQLDSEVQQTKRDFHFIGDPNWLPSDDWRWWSA